MGGARGVGRGGPRPCRVVFFGIMEPISPAPFLLMPVLPSPSQENPGGGSVPKQESGRGCSSHSHGQFQRLASRRPSPGAGNGDRHREQASGSREDNITLASNI